jgi:cardiolipin synthase
MVSLLPEVTVSTAFFVIALLAITAASVVLLVAFFSRGLRYKIQPTSTERLDSNDFLYMLEALTDAKINRRTSLEVFTNGENFYKAELSAIEGARHNINLEAYVFVEGRIARRFVDALTSKAASGVKVNVVLDGLGSVGTTEEFFKDFKAAGGKLAWYQAVRFSKLPRYNNRSHRELLIVDGRTGFIGGAGIADQWLYPNGKKPRWRDTMVKVTGDAVPNLQATFCENWLEAQGEVLTGTEYFPVSEAGNNGAVLVINSTPSGGGATRARILFQVLLASARESIHITTPYFLPDGSVSEELVRAQKRGVDIKIITPGPRTDHQLTRFASRRSYGKLLQAGVRIFEYQPGMIHAKILVIDDLWAVVGSTNFDNRSFGLNDEVNLAAMDTAFAARLNRDFAQDLAESREISYEHWRGRSLVERGPEMLGRLLERQQ